MKKFYIIYEAEKAFYINKKYRESEETTSEKNQSQRDAIVFNRPVRCFITYQQHCCRKADSVTFRGCDDWGGFYLPYYLHSI